LTRPVDGSTVGSFPRITGLATISAAAMSRGYCSR
jgi:hypothetical protein